MVYIDEEKIECAPVQGDLGFWQVKKTENVVFLFLWLFVLPNSNN